ncbi:hypothetical protein BAUCODRAFT_128817 [Baudoinia panamericana UAMH 10762]|uniref:Uncharacterized protein n=1 Tax=Baudoinia panamericana (strain UAMH 10762) TaxID=717646 RepID=M2NLY3_BAUPA|nr:uncharacterized protein BAUCODRAFT_128817 [Baudoinia panamericana UAMH 10762]EMD00181.1 hypothetical protein BAUCODRAFT_128817 [Baudoinia panamericana UAMH 10762]
MTLMATSRYSTTRTVVAASFEIAKHSPAVSAATRAAERASCKPNDTRLPLRICETQLTPLTHQCFRVGGPAAKEHTYSVTVNDNYLDVKAFNQRFLPSASDLQSAPSSTSSNGPERPSVLPESGAAADDDDDVIEVPPPKRARTESEVDPMTLHHTTDTNSLLPETIALLTHRSSSSEMNFLKQWHTEWVKQGGWLYDALNTVEKTTREGQVATSKQLITSQDVLGKAMNAASATAMSELANITRLIPWLESCRQTNAHKSQAREEKWRTNSATFHDQARREREAAGKKLQSELEKQTALLLKIAEYNGIDVDDVDVDKDEPRETRELSLGAQLTAELNMEASRAASALREKEAINLDNVGR